SAAASPPSRLRPTPEWPPRRKSARWSASRSSRARTKDWVRWANGSNKRRMKILVANLGSTSLKYRLFDFSGGQECLVTRGGMERVADHAQGVETCLGQLRDGGWITKESDLAAV